MGIWMWNGGWIFGIWDLGYGIWDYEDSMRIVMVIVMVSKDTLVWFGDGFLRGGAGKWIWVIFRMRGDGMGMGLDRG